MSAVLRPETPEQAREAIAWAVTGGKPLEVLAQGSKRGFGRPMQTEYTLDMSGLAGILAYEPEELVLTAWAGTPIAEIEAALTERGQALAFEPMDIGLIYGKPPGQGTLGGVLACNLAGPRRLKAGAARDHFLGMNYINGRGELLKAGGKVVKNVTGYDMCKLLAGSHGTLGVMTEVTVKVLPGPEKQRTVLVLGLDDRRAAAAMAEALKSPNEVSSAAHLPADRAALSVVDRVRGAGTSITAIRLEGPRQSVAARCESLRALLGPMGAIEELHTHNSKMLWREIRDVVAFLGANRKTVPWRVSVAPMRGPDVAAAVVAAHPAAAHYFDWSGGLVWLTLPEGLEDGGAATVRAAVAGAGGGHATLMRGDNALRAAQPVFEPQPPALAALTARVKESFDPKHILNPGRLYAGL